MSHRSSSMNIQDHERIVRSGRDLDQWKETFKRDKELMRETTRFVNEIVAHASSEAYKRKQALREDEDLKRATAKFLSEVIETAVTEASARKAAQAEGREFSGGNRLKMGQSIANWNNRAREFCTRVLNALCPCVTDNGKS